MSLSFVCTVRYAYYAVSSVYYLFSAALPVVAHRVAPEAVLGRFQNSVFFREHFFGVPLTLNRLLAYLLEGE